MAIARNPFLRHVPVAAYITHMSVQVSMLSAVPTCTLLMLSWDHQSKHLAPLFMSPCPLIPAKLLFVQTNHRGLAPDVPYCTLSDCTDVSNICVSTHGNTTVKFQTASMDSHSV